MWIDNLYHIKPGKYHGVGTLRKSYLAKLFFSGSSCANIMFYVPVLSLPMRFQNTFCQQVDIMIIFNCLNVYNLFPESSSKKKRQSQTEKDVLRRNIPIQDATSHGGITWKWKYLMTIIIFVSNILMVSCLYQEFGVSSHAVLS